MESEFNLKISILSISFLLMSYLTISPALVEIGKAFPTESHETLMMMVAMPSVVAIIFALIGGVLAGFMRAKTLICIGLVGYLVGGIGPIFASEFKTVLMFRVLLGAGTGLLFPFAAGLISMFFKGYERDHMFGLQSTSVGLGNIITSLIAGVLAALYWKLSFIIYSFGFITLIFVLFFLTEPVKTTGQKAKMTFSMYFNPKVLWVCFTLLLYAILYFSFFGYTAFVIDNNDFGDAKVAGLTTMLMTLASMIMGVLFAKLIRILKRFTLFVALFFNAAGFFILAYATGIVHIFAGSIVLGLGFGLLMPFGVYVVNNYSEKPAFYYSNALLMAAISIGSPLGAKFFVEVAERFNNSDGQFIFLICGLCLTISALIAAVWLLVPTKTAVSASVE